MLDLKSIICAGYSCILHLQAMAEEVLVTAILAVTVFTRAAGHHQGSHLPCGPENWREIQDEAEIYQTGPDCNRQVSPTHTGH